MSFNRNKVEDNKNTEQVIFGNSSLSKGVGKKNWLDHSGACEKIDEMLIRGANFNQLLTSGRKESAVRSHLNHLKSDHGLPISNSGGIYKFDFPIQSNLSRNSFTKPSSGKDQTHEPTLIEIGKILEKLSRKGDSND